MCNIEISIIVCLKKGVNMVYHCPRCGYPQYCGCDACKKDVPEGMKPWVDVDGELIACANCGLTRSIDWWETLEVDISDIMFKTR